MSKKGKIFCGLSLFLLWGSWLMCWPWAIFWADGNSVLTFFFFFLWCIGGAAVAFSLTVDNNLYDLFAEKFPASPTTKTNSTPKIDFRPPPKDLFEYGKDVELPEKKEEPKIINPWQKKVTAGGER